MAFNTLSPQKISDLHTSQFISHLRSMGLRLTPRYQYSQTSHPRTSQVGPGPRTNPSDLQRRSLRIAYRGASYAVFVGVQRSALAMKTGLELSRMEWVLPPSCHCQYLRPRKVSMRYRRGSRLLPPDRRPNQWAVVRLPTRARALVLARRSRSSRPLCCRG